MKYLIIFILAIIVSLFESTIGGLSPFVYVPYTIMISILLFWSLDRPTGLVFLGLTGVLIDLLSHNWIGTTYLAFFAGLLVVEGVNALVDVKGEERKFFGSSIQLIFALAFNYFLIILQNNSLTEVSYVFLLESIIVSILSFGLLTFIFNLRGTRRKSLYA